MSPELILDRDESTPAFEPARPIDEIIKESASSLKQSEMKPMKRKRGRPKASKPDTAQDTPLEAAQVVQAAPPPDYVPMIKDLAEMGSGILSETLGAPAALTDEEKQRLSIGLNPLMQKWFPTMGEMSPEMTAAICVASIGFGVWMRLKAEKEKKLADESKPVAA